MELERDYGFRFAEDGNGTPADGEAADKISWTMVYKQAKKDTSFVYNAELGKYVWNQYGKEMHDQIHAGWEEQLVKNLAAAQMAGRGYVAIVDGKVAGFAAYRLDGKMGVVARNAVDPVYRGRGIAKLMYGKLINGMIAEGYQYARVHTGLDEGHTGARRAYGKVGFQRNLPSTVYYREL